MYLPCWLCLLFLVALLAEGVDRNLRLERQVIAGRRSPSSRRAWIEIRCACLTLEA